MINLSMNGFDRTVDRTPGECPICHHAIDARYLTGVVLEATPFGSALAEAVFQCPQRQCLRTFIGRYSGEFDRSINSHLLKLRNVAPFHPKAPEHPAEIAELSPQFVEIFAQASAGEAWELSEIAGCGYRKALEFLIKDYCVGEVPAKADENPPQAD